MSKLNLTLKEILFTVSLLVFISLTNFQHGFMCLSAFIIYLVFQSKLEDNNRSWIHHKSSMKGFVIVFLVTLILQLLVKFTIVDSGRVMNLSYFQIIIFAQLPFVLSLLLAYFAGVKYKNFNWSIGLRETLIILLINMPFLLELGLDGILSRSLETYLIMFVWKFFYPVIGEEVIFRGLMLSGLLSLGVKKDNANIIQALVFGLIHLVNFNSISIVILLGLSLQVFLGYLLGKITLKTKSLTPSILFHILLDVF